MTLQNNIYNMYLPNNIFDFYTYYGINMQENAKFHTYSDKSTAAKMTITNRAKSIIFKSLG